MDQSVSLISEVSGNEILKIIKNSSIKSCLLDPVPTFLKDCVDILLPSITKFVNLSLMRVFFPKNPGGHGGRVVTLSPPTSEAGV